MKKSTKIILGISAISAFTYGANRFMHYISTKDNLLSFKNSFTYNWTYGNIYYTKKGTGTPLLLLHDISFYGNSYEFNAITDKLAKHYTVYSLDFLGCGKSEKPKMEYTNFLYVKQICNFIENIIGEKTSIFASNHAVSVVLMANKYQPELFDKIILGNPQDIYENSENKEINKLQSLGLEIPLFGTFAYNLISTERKLTSLLENSFYDKSKCSNHLINCYLEAAHLGDANAKFVCLSMKRNYLAANTIIALDNMNNLSIILGEEADNGIEIASHYKKYVQDTCIYKIPNTKDLPQLEAPTAFTKALLHALEN